MKKDIQFIANVILNKKIDSNRKIEILGNFLFRNARREVSAQFKYSKAVEWYIELNSLLLTAKIDVYNSIYYDPDFVVPLNDRDYELINKVSDYINDKYIKWTESSRIYSKYQKMSLEWAKNIHPSHQKKGDWTHSAIDNAQKVINNLKDEYSELHSKLRVWCSENNTSENLIMMICSRLLFLTRLDDETYQFNLKNEDILAIMNEYYKITNIEPYADEYNKISLIRTVMNQVVQFCFSKEFEITNEGYCIRKYHSRLLLKVKKTKQAFHETKSINNHYITYNDSNNLLHKLSSSFYYITLKYHNIHYDKDAFSAGDNDFNTS